MANIRNITKKLVNLGFSEDKLMMMTEKEIREVYKVAKEGITMKNNTIDVEASNSETLDLEVEMEESLMKNNTNNVETNNSATVVKEEITMEALVKRLTENKKVQDVGYIKKDELRVILNEQFGFGFNNKATRTEMANAFMAMYKDSLRVADEIAYGNTVEDNSVSVGDLDITHDNAPESIEESPATVVFDDGLALKILEKVIRQADTNKAHNFISDWMLTSIISELVIGHPLKDKGHEYYKSFTDEQRKILVDMRKAFINKTHLITKTNNGKVTGYYIPAKILVWGRHIYLGVACVYRYVNNNKILAEYHVSLNGIKNTATGNITALDDAAYETLDIKCVFVM